MPPPPASRLRRNPFGGPQQLEIRVFVDKDGNYVPKNIPVRGGPFRSIPELYAAVRARYRDAARAYYLSRRRRSPRDPPLPPPCEEEHVTEPTSAQTLQEPDVSSLKELLDATTLEESSVTATASSSPQLEAVAQDTIKASPPSGRCLPLSPGSRIWARRRRDWGFTFYVRVDLGGSFHTYPHLGGPFQSLEEADNAIDRHLRERQVSKMCMEQDGVSPLEMAIRHSLYWPDGTRKKRSKSHVIEKTRNRIRRLVQALVDKYNEDHNLLGDLAYELKDVVHYQSICENHVWYYHLNFTTTKGAGDFDCGIDNLFFAELKCMRQGKLEELVASCFCMVKPTDNGHCYGCTNNGSVNMKHPNRTDEYTGGHLDTRLPFGCYREWSDSDDDVEAKEFELRRMYEGLDDPGFVDRLFTLPSYVTMVED